MEQKIASRFYEVDMPYNKATRNEYNRLLAEKQSAFMEDGTKYLIENGVPTQYASKVMYMAWDNGHAHGYGSVFEW